MRIQHIKLSTNELIFKKNEISEQEIRIQWNNPNIKSVKMSHNLPECFVLDDKDAIIKAPGYIKIKYTGSVGHMIFGTLQINLTYQIFSSTPPDGISIDVKFEEEESQQRLEAMECKICLRQFSEDDANLTPRILSACGHTLCEECIKSLLNGPIIQCPFDRKETRGYLEYLPKNFTIIEILRENAESERTKKMMETVECEDPDIPCFENPKHESTCYCESCKKDFCKNCFTSTHSSKTFSSHIAVPISEKSFVLPKCPIHEDVEAVFFCKDKKCQEKSKIFCITCLIRQHKSHKHEKLAKKAVRNQYLLGKMVEKLKFAETQFQKKSQSIKNDFQKTAKYHVRREQQIKSYNRKKEEEELKKLRNLAETKKIELKKEEEKIHHDLDWTAAIRKDIEKTLKKKTNLQCFNQLMKKGRVMCSLEIASDDVDDQIPRAPNSFLDRLLTEVLPSTSDLKSNPGKRKFQKRNSKKGKRSCDWNHKKSATV